MELGGPGTGLSEVLNVVAVRNLPCYHSIATHCFATPCCLSAVSHALTKHPCLPAPTALMGYFRLRLCSSPLPLPARVGSSRVLCSRLRLAGEEGCLLPVFDINRASDLITYHATEKLLSRIGFRDDGCSNQHLRHTQSTASLSMGRYR